MEVERKKDKVDGKSPAKLTKYLAGHVVPVVIGPDGVPYMTDHHHTCLALLESGRVADVPATVIEVHPGLSPKIGKVSRVEERDAQLLAQTKIS